MADLSPRDTKPKITRSARRLQNRSSVTAPAPRRTIKVDSVTPARYDAIRERGPVSQTPGTAYFCIASSCDCVKVMDVDCFTTLIDSGMSFSLANELRFSLKARFPLVNVDDLYLSEPEDLILKLLDLVHLKSPVSVGDWCVPNSIFWKVHSFRKDMGDLNAIPVLGQFSPEVVNFLSLPFNLFLLTSFVSVAAGTLPPQEERFRSLTDKYVDQFMKKVEVKDGKIVVSPLAEVNDARAKISLYYRLAAEMCGNIPTAKGSGSNLGLVTVFVTPN